jgi:hypothetical protein
MSRESPKHDKLMGWQAADAALGKVIGILATSYELEPAFVETDLLPALLGLGAWDDRSWASRVALEKALAGLEATSILTDQRKYRGRPRSLHVELLPAIGTAGQLLHAKVLLVVQERAVRLQIASANLTGKGYRENREVAVPLVATEDRPALAALVRDGLAGMPVRLAPWWTDGANAVHSLATARLEAWAGDGAGDARVVWGGGPTPLWREVVERWPAGEAIDRISIVSPFWSEEDENGPLATLTTALRARGTLPGRLNVDLYVEAEPASSSTYRPKLPSLGRIDPDALGIALTARAVDPRPTAEPGAGDVLKLRALHAKVLIVHGVRTTLGYTGSANFTVPGWGFGNSPARANIEAGVVLLRKGTDLAAALLPPTTGQILVIRTSDGALPAATRDPDPVAPTFLRGIWLEPDKGDTDRLRLAIRIAPGSVRGAFSLSTLGEKPLALHAGCPDAPEESHLSLDPGAVVQLLRDQQVSVAWWASPAPVEYPVNVSPDARVRLPGAPGSPNPGERELLAYYQGRIRLEGLFPPPPGWDDDEQASPPEPVMSSEVDTSRIQSYVVREFVEALRGIRDDLSAAAGGTPATMRLAVQGPVSPVALARSVMAASLAGRSATAAGFQLAEIASCLLEAAGRAEREEWRVILDDSRRILEGMLAELVVRAPGELGDGTAFARYARRVIGWYPNGGRAA